MKKRIAEFRSATAFVILGNVSDIACGTSDMRDIYHIAELCEQYSLLIVLNWRATKYGFPLCAKAIDQDMRIDELTLLSWASLADRYPLQLHHDPTKIKQV